MTNNLAKPDRAPRLILAVAGVALFLFSLVATASTEWTDEALPLADDSKPLYQWTG